MTVGFVNLVRYWSMRAFVECVNEGRHFTPMPYWRRLAVG